MDEYYICLCVYNSCPERNVISPLLIIWLIQQIHILTCEPGSSDTEGVIHTPSILGNGVSPSDTAESHTQDTSLFCREGLVPLQRMHWAYCNYFSTLYYSKYVVFVRLKWFFSIDFKKILLILEYFIRCCRWPSTMQLVFSVGFTFKLFRPSLNITLINCLIHIYAAVKSSNVKNKADSIPICNRIMILSCLCLLWTSF